MRNILMKIIIVAVFLLMEAILVPLNTNKLLKSFDKVYKVTGTYTDLSYEGRKAEGDLQTVSTLAQIEEISYNDVYFFSAVSMEPTGIYKLLDEKYEGIVRVGKTFNFFPRKLFTDSLFLPTVYPGMYGEFYIAQLVDGSSILVLVGCNDKAEVRKGDLSVMARYHTGAVEGRESYYADEVSEALKALEASMELRGYINLADSQWADRHSFGLFFMSVVKALISLVVAAAVYIKTDNLFEGK